MTFAEKVISFNESLNFPNDITLPRNINVLNPFQKDDLKNETQNLSVQFYKKYFSDQNKRHLILGINPGKNGAGITGIPFTSPKNLKQDCNIPLEDNTSEVSGGFIYRMIEQFGGVEKFYNNFFISNISPLGFVKTTDKGRKVNINYYDYIDLMTSTTPFIVKTLKQQIEFGIHTDKVFCLGNTSNTNYLKNICAQYGLFKKVVPLPHPRYVAQYKKKQEEKYIHEYISAFKTI